MQLQAACLRWLLVFHSSLKIFLNLFIMYNIAYVLCSVAL